MVGRVRGVAPSSWCHFRLTRPADDPALGAMNGRKLRAIPGYPWVPEPYAARTS